MPRKRTDDERTYPSASSPEARENQVIAMAYDLAESQIRAGTASSQVITHFLRMGSAKERLEREKMSEEKKLLSAKTESLESAKRMEALIEDALAAMRSYTGNDDEEYDGR